MFIMYTFVILQYIDNNSCSENATVIPVYIVTSNVDLTTPLH